MRKMFATVTRKVVIGYLLIVMFSLLAVGFALFRLHDQTRQTQQLVNVDFRSFELVRDLQQNLLAQENIEKQLLILKDSELRDLRVNRNQELADIYQQLTRLPLPDLKLRLIEPVNEYRQAVIGLSAALQEEDWDEALAISSAETVPLRTRLLETLIDLRQEQQARMNSQLSALSEQASDAYRLTLLLTLVGIALSAPVGLMVIISIHRSVNALKRATLEISGGSFEHRPRLPGNDEFAQLARAFIQMGSKLRELEQLRLDANPLTRLPGNLAIDREVDRRIGKDIPFAHLYIDLDNFKVYSDRYGYKAGSDVLGRVGHMIQQAVESCGEADDLVGHIGGDDYVVITTPVKGEPLAAKIIEEFEQIAPSFYNQDDRQAGRIVGKDRYGVERTFPLMTMSIAVIFSEHYEEPSRLAISQDCARVKEFLKGEQGSNYMLDRRK